MTSPDAHATGNTPPGQLTITIYDADAGGPPKYVHDGPGEKVGKAIEKALGVWEITPTPGDRLICLANGSNVRDSADMHLRDYAATVCGDLIWSYSRDTGGA